MNNNYLFLITFLIYSCSSVEIETSSLNVGKNVILPIADQKKEIFSKDSNYEFIEYLNSDWEIYLSENPVFTSLLGDKRFNTKITRNTIDQYEITKNSIINSLNNLKKIDYDELSEENKLNYNLKKLGLEYRFNNHKFPMYFMELNQRGGVQSYHDIGNRLNFESKSDYYDWFERITLYSKNIKTSLELNQLGLKNGYTQPKVITQGVVTQIDRILNSTIENHPYLKIFKEADDSLFANNEKEELILKVKDLINTNINPAYKELNDFLKNNYLPNSRDSIGLKDVPNGKEWYEWVAKYHTTTDLTPDQIHDIGLSEIKRIRQEMEEIIESVEWDGDFKSFLNYLRTSPRFYYDNPEDLFNAYLIMSKTIDPLLPKIFKVFPRAPYGVIPIPEESAPFTTTAYYNSPSEGRAGYFYANLYKPESRPKYEIPVLTVHEAVPGHHFQISIAQELENVPSFRKYQSFTAFVEGWGLYSEELGEFIKIYDDPYDKFGQLTYDMWRAIRLVVDTGMHYKDWSRQDAIDLFLENTAKSELDIQNEVDRYIAWPGQALAYKIGQLKILELRNKAESALGEKYDIRDFHHEILKRGSLPLEMLEYYIDEWIKDALNS